MFIIDLSLEFHSINFGISISLAKLINLQIVAAISVCFLNLSHSNIIEVEDIQFY